MLDAQVIATQFASLLLGKLGKIESPVRTPIFREVA
jgi:hypothetical protein